MIKTRQRRWYTKSAAAFRWLHIYLSMLGFAALMFFAFTGITLNHPTWFGAGEHSLREQQGTLPAQIIEPIVDKLAVAETLRNNHVLKGRLAEFDVSQDECMVVFKGPGYSADIFIDRADGTYTLSETTTGLMSVLNDLHKGRDSGIGWAWVIDLSAVLMMLMSLSGFGILFYLKRRRASGILTAVAGTIFLFVAWTLFVP